MSSQYEGATKVTLYEIPYPLIINLRVLSQFNVETGQDFHHVATKALSRFQHCDLNELQGLERSTQLTSVVSMSNAAWFFYLAAKEANSQVKFEEIQEALLWEGPLIREKTSGYAVKFIETATFAIIGILEEAEKKNLPE